MVIPTMTFKHPALLFLLPLIVSLAACGGDIVTHCDADGPVTPLCGVQMPEDIEVLPADGGLLISEFGDMGKLPGYLTWYQPGPNARFIRLVDSTTITAGAGDNWGDPSCQSPERLSPHGIHLAARDDALQLLVVNHGAREQVLFYEVIPSGNRDQAPDLAWRGCVAFPDYAVLNDVASLPRGGFAVTHMYDRENVMLAQLKSMLGLNKGHVWRWFPDSGARIITGSSARMPNGIEVDPSGNSLWVNNYIDGEVVQYDASTDEILSVAEIPNIDNSAWLEDGRLAIASHYAPLSMMPCFSLTRGSCGHGYDIVALDPAKPDQPTVIFAHAGGGPFGPATVAVPYNGKLYLGSFSGDRLGETKVD